MYGQRIKTLRTENGYTQESLAEKIGDVSPKTVGSWEREDRMPSLTVISFLAKLFNVSTDYLLGTSNIKIPSDDGKVDLADAIKNPDLFSYQGKDIPPEDLEVIKRILDSRK